MLSTRPLPDQATNPRRRRTTIALLLDSLVSEYAVSVRRSVERAAAAQDISVLTIMGHPLGDPIASYVTQNQIYELVCADCVDGIIISSATMGHYAGPEGLAEFCRGFAPLPVCSVGVALDGITSVIIDNEGGMRAGVEHLIDAHGARRVAFIGGPEASVESNLRLSGYRKALESRGLTFDPRLVKHGNFTPPAGAAKMQELLEASIPFDALVTANDDTAFGALNVLQEAGLHVPRDIQVSGFDDIHSAHFARPSLSTLRQPMWWLGERAVANILGLLRNEPVAALSAGRVEFVRRDSCGCGFQASLPQRQDADRPHEIESAAEHRRRLCARMEAAVSIPNDALGDWASRLLDALDEELAGQEGRFSTAFEDVLDHAQQEGASLDEFQRVVSVMRADLREVSTGAEDGNVERIWHNARVLVGAASIRALGRQKLEQQTATSRLGWVGERLSTTLSLSLLKEEIVSGLPQLEIERGVISLYTGSRSGMLRVLAARTESGEFPLTNQQYPDKRLAPEFLFDTETCRHFVIVPLTYDTEVLGVAALAGEAKPSIYEALRQQIGSAVKGAMLHREVVAQVTLRAQLEAERVEKESRIAAEIQTSMKPAITEVHGLQIATLMAPAAEAGGDYYDVLPTANGAWIGIGDVTGHGLASGLIMLMIQSMIASLARVEPAPSPSQIVAAVGDALWDNVRLRLKRDDHATLTVFRYHGGGRFTFAGAHEDLIVWRSRSGRCETISTPGFWVGAVPSVRRMTYDSELKLERGDVLVLYSDGVTEALSAHHEHFSLERLVRYVEDSAREPVDRLRDNLHEAVRAWSASLADDVTLVIVRYQGD